jgi:hypothetical protein
MNAKLIGALLAACSASFAMPALAAGDGGASGVRTDGVMQASQPVHAAQVMPPHDGKSHAASKNQGGVGGTGAGKSESGHREPRDTIDPMYRGG